MLCGTFPGYGVRPGWLVRARLAGMDRCRGRGPVGPIGVRGAMTPQLRHRGGEMDEDNRATLERTLEATFRSDFEAAGLAMADDAVVEWPQSGERIVGRQACLTVYKNYPGGSPAYQLRRITGGPDVFTVEARGDYGGEIAYLTR